ncbi:MAG: hypothetical protein ACYDER_10445 [Ktedonobacteraceae bacterium]
MATCCPLYFKGASPVLGPILAARILPITNMYISPCCRSIGGGRDKPDPYI